MAQTNDKSSFKLQLIESVKAFDSDRTRKVLDSVECSSLSLIDVKDLILPLLCDVENNYDEKHLAQFSESRRHIIYMIVDAGFNIESKTQNGNTCLFEAVKNEDTSFCEILLQCGADMWSNTEFNLPIFNFVEKYSSFEVKEVFNKYYPGVWKAVETENIYEVRKLVNLWCRTDLYKNGKTLKDIALETGNEEIISLILGITDSMKLVYHIYAKNTLAVRKLLETNRQRIRLDLRKMSDNGAPIIYYLIQSANVAVIELFIKHGCQLYSVMQDLKGYDMPVLFSALTAETPSNVIEALLPEGKTNQEEMLYKILYMGQTVLEVAVKENVTSEVFSVLIDRGGPQLLCERNQNNYTVRDLALIAGKKQYAEVIDSIILSWILYPYKYPGRRQKLALYGWNLAEVEKELKENLYLDEYFSHYKSLQNHMEEMADAVDTGNFGAFLELKDVINETDNFLWYGRVVGQGMPLLHRAVLSNSLRMVEIILEEKPSRESIDNLFDQNRRTALHYAYASASTKQIRILLMSYGCSEHVLDKVNREPLDFRDQQDTPGMAELLRRLKMKNFATPEIDPWETGGSSEADENSSCHPSDEINSNEDTEYESEEEYDSSETERPPAMSCAIM